MKLSLFLNIKGLIIIIFIVIIKINNIKILSLIIKIGFSLIKSVLFIIPIGLLDLFLCRIIIWIIDITISIAGIIKWIDKNRLIRIILILKFPHTILIIFFPIYGIAAIKFVITIIAQ